MAVTFCVPLIGRPENRIMPTGMPTTYRFEFEHKQKHFGFDFDVDTIKMVFARFHWPALERQNKIRLFVTHHFAHFAHFNHIITRHRSIFHKRKCIMPSAIYLGIGLPMAYRMHVYLIHQIHSISIIIRCFVISRIQFQVNWMHDFLSLWFLVCSIFISSRCTEDEQKYSHTHTHPKTICCVDEKPKPETTCE